MSNCEYSEPYVDARKHLQNKQCKNAASGLFCLEHKQSTDVLAVAAACGYPRFVAKYMQDAQGNRVEVWVISEGRESWEGYARIHPTRYHTDIMRRLKSLQNEQEPARKEKVG